MSHGVNTLHVLALPGAHPGGLLAGRPEESPAGSTELGAAPTVLTLPGLIERALRDAELGGRRSAVGPLGEVLLLDAVAADAAGPLGMLHGVAGLRRALARTFVALGCADLGPQTLPRLAERLARAEPGSELAARVAELGRLYQRYRGLLGPHRLDTALAWAQGIRGLTQGKLRLPLVAEAHELVVHGLHRLPPWDAQPTPHGLMQGLAGLAGLASPQKQARLVRVVLPALDSGPGGQAERPALDQALRPLLDALYERHAQSIEVAWAPLGPHLAPAVADLPWGRFLRGLFQSARATPLVQPAEVADEQLRLLCLPSPAAEARQVARTIRDLLAGGAAPAEIAVIAETSGRRARLVQELLRYDVPVHLPSPIFQPTGLTLGQDAPALPPPLALVLGIYELLGDGAGSGQALPREGLIQLLTTRYLRWPVLSDGSDAAPVRPWQVARALRGAGVRDLGLLAGGESSAELHRRVDEWLRQQRPRGRRPAKPESGPENETKSDPEPALLRHLETILSELRQLPAMASLTQHGVALRRLSERLQLRARAAGPGRDRGMTWLGRSRLAGAEGELGGSDGEEALLAAELRALARDQAAVALLEQVLDELPRRAQQLRLADEPLSRTRFAALVQRALAGLLPPAALGGPGLGVEVAALAQLQPRRWRHLFVTGMLDGELPAPAAEDPLLDDDERRLCNRLLDAPVWPLAGQASQRAALLFAEALAHADAAHLSWPAADEEGRPLLRSPFIETVLHAACRTEPTPLSESLVPAAADARHPVELWTRLGQTQTVPGQQALGAALAARDRRRASRLSARIELEASRAAWFAAFAAGRVDFQPGPRSGQLSDPALIAALAPRLPGSRDRPLSASALEDYARCPFRFFVYRVLQAAPIPEGGDDIDPLARGNLYHKVLETFFAQRRDCGRLPLRADEDDRAALEWALDKSLEEFADAERSGHPALFQVRLRRLRAELWQLVVREAQSPIDSVCQPALLEHKFGPLAITAAAAAEESEDSALHIGGIIDRIDVGPGRALVLDYKTGRLKRYQDYLRSELLVTSFQLPLYAAAAQADPAVRAAAGAAGPPMVSARYYAVRQAQVTEALDDPALIALDPATRQQAGEHNVAEAAYHLWRKLRGGDFRVAPRTCDGCGLESVCRIAVPSVLGEPGDEDDESASSSAASRPSAESASEKKIG